MSEQRVRPTVDASHRSIIPSIQGVPWWAALLIGAIATALGYAIDAGSGHKDLTALFAGLYVIGCVTAVLAVRQSGVFTAVIQPPLILFCAVPGAYWMFHGRKIGHLKDLLINCGYPLIERFPLMLGTAAGVLLIGLVRWYFGMTHRSGTVAKGEPAGAAEPNAAAGSVNSFQGLLSSGAAKLAALVRGGAQDEDDSLDGALATDAPAPKGDRPPRTRPRNGRATRGSRDGQRPNRAHSRHGRPLGDDYPGLQDELREGSSERPRRNDRRRQPPARDYDSAGNPVDPPRRPRRPRPEGEPEPRTQQPREGRRDPYGRTSPYERPARRTSSRLDSHEPPGQGDQFSYERSYQRYDAYEPHDPPRRRPRPGSNGSSPTHHPVSQVRYRGAGATDQLRDSPRDDLRDDPRGERGSRSRAPRRQRTDNWEYDN